MVEKPKKEPEIRVKTSKVFKLKDRPGRNYQGVHLVKTFGFVPEIVIVEKVRGRNNALMVRAVLTKEELEKEKKSFPKYRKKQTSYPQKSKVT